MAERDGYEGRKKRGGRRRGIVVDREREIENLEKDRETLRETHRRPKLVPFSTCKS